MFSKYKKIDNFKASGKIRILLVIRWPVGGIRTFIRYVYQNFNPAKFDLTIAAPDMPELKLMLEDLMEHHLTYILSESTPSSLDFFKFVFKTILLGEYDLIHSQGLTSGLCSAIPALIVRKPHLLTNHDVFTEKQFEGITGLGRKLLLNIMLPIIKVIHSVSYDARENLFEFVGSLRFCKEKVVAIPNGIEIERFLNAVPIDFRKELDLPPDSFIIGFLGRFMSQKGFVYLIDALNKLSEMHNLPKKPILLTFSGEDGFIREEKEYVRKKGLDKVIHFLPFSPNAAPVLKGLDVVAMPSLWEACGLLAMEAMVAGTPIIGTNCIGLREVLNDTPGIMVPARDSNALAEILYSEMVHPSKKRFKAFQYEAARRFNVKKQANEIESLILKMLNRN